MNKPTRYYGWWKTRKGEFRFNAINRNGEIVHPSESYTTRSMMMKTINGMVKQLASPVPVLELGKFGKGRPSPQELRAAEAALVGAQVLNPAR